MALHLVHTGFNEFVFMVDPVTAMATASAAFTTIKKGFAIGPRSPLA